MLKKWARGVISLLLSTPLLSNAITCKFNAPLSTSNETDDLEWHWTA